MITWLTYGITGIAALAGLLCVVLGLIGRKPSDLSLGSAALVELLLLVQLVVAIIAPATGNNIYGDPIEFYAYLICALIIPAAAVFWGLLDRTRWSTVIVGVGLLAVSVMVIRMEVIWTTVAA
ncbi:hypothetical protein D9V34_08210 [Mycetocola lacteus]|uniref:Integral membrane protein n=1 Tax=Mycetocola lacteus TaxID=76637 RepID=A0A3L7ASV5_9MICO|nr:hypothetical protein [Mycetocola lacteus]RLP83204.1 hypothetical protein D9V34_08210 [Mycetocola lacteus]